MDVTDNPKEGVMHLDLVDGAYTLGLEDRSHAGVHYRERRAPKEGNHPYKIDERYSHSHFHLTKVLCFGGDARIAKEFLYNTRHFKDLDFTVGSDIKTLVVPPYHTVTGVTYRSDRMTGAYKGLEFTVVARVYDREKKTFSAVAEINSKVTEKEAKVSGEGVFWTVALDEPYDVQPGTELVISLEVKTMPNNIKDATFDQEESKEQARLQVGVNVLQVYPQVDEGLGDQFVTGRYESKRDNTLGD